MFRILDNMRYVVVASVGDCGAQVGKVQGSAADFSLSDRKGDYVCGFPCILTVNLVVICSVRDCPSEFGREIAAELPPEPETFHIFVPFVQGFGDGAVFPVFENAPEDIAVVCVAGHHYRLFKVERRPVVMASEPVASEIIAHAARIFSLGGEHSFLKSDKPVYEFEYRAGRIWGLYCPVEHRLVWVIQYFIVMAAEVREYVHIYSWAGDQSQDLACGRLYGHKASDFVLHQHLPVFLEICIDSRGDVVPGNCLLVHFPVPVPRFDLVARISEKYGIAFLSAQLLFPGCLYACFACIVAAGVFTVMAFDISLVDFRDISEKISSGVEGVFPYASRLSSESGEPVCDFREFQICLRRDLFQHDDAPVSYPGPVPVVFVHLFPDEFGTDAEDIAQGQRVECLHFLRGHEEVVCHLVAYQYLAVPVVDYSAGRVYGLVHH